MAAEKEVSKKNGGKGKAFVFRNALLVAVKALFGEEATYEVLGEIFGIDRTTAHEIYKRDQEELKDSIKVKSKLSL